MPLDGPAQPHSKDAALARGEKRYRRKVASPKQWQAIRAAKCRECRICGETWERNRAVIEAHHLVARDGFGDDVFHNIVGLCRADHDRVERRDPMTCRIMLERLTDAEYAYMVERGGENYAERAYGLVYTRA